MKKKEVALLLAIFLGFTGAHKFYLGETQWGMGYAVILFASIILAFFAIGLLGFVLVGILQLIDIVNLAAMKRSTFNLRYNRPDDIDTPQNKAA